MKRRHIVPLSSQMKKIIEELKPLTSKQRWLFPSPRNDGRCMSNNGVRVALRAVGFTNEQITPHGFRAMFSTLANEHGWNRDVIERQLAHVEGNSVRGAYNHAEYLPERIKLMQWWADYFPIWRRERTRGYISIIGDYIANGCENPQLTKKEEYANQWGWKTIGQFMRESYNRECDSV